jgi:uncharacterized protein (TIGR01777 family)
MKVVISGVSGLIGTALRSSLTSEGHEVLALSRRQSLPPIETMTWDVSTGRFDPSGLEGTDAVVHLAGEPVAQRWTDKSKKAIRESRIAATRLLVEGLKSLKNPPKLLISASAVGFYGDGGDTELDESSPPGEGFLPDVCQEWEKAALEALGLGIRAVCVRIGIILSTKGGALAKLLLPFKLGVGGPAGSGRQWMPWIHIDDLAGAFRFVIQEEDLMGVVNGTSPNPATNAEFSTALGRALHRPAFMPAPAFGLKILFGEMAQIVLQGQRVLPKKLLGAGYEFKYPKLLDALEDVIQQRK